MDFILLKGPFKMNVKRMKIYIAIKTKCSKLILYYIVTFKMWTS